MLRRVAPVFAAVTLGWLHDGGERALLDHDFGVLAQSLPVPGRESSYDDFALIDACPLPPSAPPSLAGSGCFADSGPARPAAHPEGAQVFVRCSHNFEVHTASITNEDDNGFALVGSRNDQLMGGLCDDCTMNAHEDEDGRQVSGLAVYICEGCQGGYHSHCIQDGLGLAAMMPGRGLSDVLRSDLSLVEHRLTWRCGDCVEDDRWGVRSLVESMLTFGTATGRIGSRRHLAGGMLSGCSGGTQRPCRDHLHPTQLRFHENPLI